MDAAPGTAATDRLEQILERPLPHDRWVAPGGWQRGVAGVAVGLVAGVLVVAADRWDIATGRRTRSGWGEP